MDLKYQANAIKLILSMMDGRTPTTGIIPYQPQKRAFAPAASVRLPRSSPERQGVESRRLDRFVRTLRDDPRCALHSVMVLRNGYVLAEYSAPPYRADLWHATYSLCKTITGLAIGMLVDDGKLRTDDRILDIFSKYAPPIAALHLRGLTVEHLLTMSSGVQFNEAGSVTETDWLGAFLESGVRFEPGTDFMYNSMNSYVLSCIVREVTGHSMTAFLRERLWKPLGAGPVYWEKSPQGVEKGGWGLYMCIEDMAKVGQLLLQQGEWNGRQLVSKDWCRRAMAVQKAVPPEVARFNYGYQMWSGHDTPLGLMNGMYGQNVMILPETNTVIAITAGAGDMFQGNPFFDYLDRYFGEDYCPDEPLPPRVQLPKKKKDPLTRALLSVRTSVQALLRPKQEPALAEPVPPLCAALAGRTFRTAPGTASTVGLLPMQIQAFQNNFTAGLSALSFRFEDGGFVLDANEGGVRHTVPVGFGRWRETTLSFAGEPYRVASEGRVSKTEDGAPVLIVTIHFLEMPQSREIRLYPSDGTLRVRWSETPGYEFVQWGLEQLKGDLRQHPIMDTISSRLDGEYVLYRIKGAMQPELTLTEEPDDGEKEAPKKEQV